MRRKIHIVMSEIVSDENDKLNRCIKALQSMPASSSQTMYGFFIDPSEVHLFTQDVIYAPACARHWQEES
ncbi:hypothetical protein EfmGK941_03230 [Enterococcus faecium]|nr:hypothetical protein EfmGK941_03230 [Enterococcus faecium]